MGTVKALLGDFVRRQLSFLGRTGKLVLTGFVDGKRARGRHRETVLTYLGKMKHKLPMERLQMAKNRTVCPSCIHVNLHVLFRNYTH